MIAYLAGDVIERTPTTCVVFAMGVGYRVQTTSEPPLWIHAVTSEMTGTVLYGFANTAERDAFVQLLAVDGVGPKTALAIVNAKADPRSVTSLCAVRGIGKKTAEKIVEAQR